MTEAEERERAMEGDYDHLRHMGQENVTGKAGWVVAVVLGIKR